MDKIKELSSLFAIDVCAFFILSNHDHIVMYVDQKRSLKWEDEEVVEHWKRLFRGVLLVDRYKSGQCGTDAEADKALEVIGLWRERLSDISWYMRSLNEHIARKANKEDGCKGRFWEGRFKSQALLEERALFGLYGLCGSESHPGRTQRNAGWVGLHIDPGAHRGASTCP